jgi:acyl-CoA thioesterase
MRNTWRDKATQSLVGSDTALLGRVGSDVDGTSFWRNVETIPVTLAPVWPPESEMDPLWREWIRLRQPVDKRNAWLNAAYIAMLMDLQGWIPAWRQHAWKNPPFVGVSLTLHVTFNGLARATSWLLADGHAPLVIDGVVGWTGRLWSESGQLVASGTGETLCRKVR